MDHLKVAVTGADGFIGSHLMKTLVSDNHVTGFDFLGDFASPFDLINAIRLGENFDVVLHFGANSNAQAQSLEQNYFENSGFTDALISVCASKNTPMVFASSAAIYGSQTGNFTLSPYALSKKISEESIARTKALFPEWRVLVLRLNNIYGLGEEKKGSMASIPFQFVQSAKYSGLIEIWTTQTDGKLKIPSRDFLNVEDLCSIISMYINKSNWTLKTIDVGTGRSISYQSIAEMISAKVACEVKFIELPGHVSAKNYQFYTKANIEWLIEDSPNYPFTPLEIGLQELIGN